MLANNKYEQILSDIKNNYKIYQVSSVKPQKLNTCIK